MARFDGIIRRVHVLGRRWSVYYPADGCATPGTYGVGTGYDYDGVMVSPNPETATGISARGEALRAEGYSTLWWHVVDAADVRTLIPAGRRFTLDGRPVDMVWTAWVNQRGGLDLDDLKLIGRLRVGRGYTVGGGAAATFTFRRVK